MMYSVNTLPSVSLVTLSIDGQYICVEAGVSWIVILYCCIPWQEAYHVTSLGGEECTPRGLSGARRTATTGKRVFKAGPMDS